jgi:hypothetical protein
MSNSSHFALLSNGASVPWAENPEWPVKPFVGATAAELERGGRLCSWFGVPDHAGTHLGAVLAFDADNTLAVGRSEPATGAYPALTPRQAQAHLFERDVWSNMASSRRIIQG